MNLAFCILSLMQATVRVEKVRRSLDYSVRNESSLQLDVCDDELNLLNILNSEIIIILNCSLFISIPCFRHNRDEHALQVEFWKRRDACDPKCESHVSRRFMLLQEKCGSTIPRAGASIVSNQ